MFFYLTFFLFSLNTTLSQEYETLTNSKSAKEKKEKINLTKKEKSYKSNSILNSGKWFKIKVEKDGVYKIPFSDLKNMFGIENPENVRMFGNGGKQLSYYNSDDQQDDIQEINIEITDSCVLFYGKGTVQWSYDSDDDIFLHEIHQYSDSSYYFLTEDYNSGADNRIASEELVDTEPNVIVNTFNDYSFLEIDSLNIIESGQSWFWKLFDYYLSYNFNFIFPNSVDSTAVLTVAVLGRASSASSFTVKSKNVTDTIDIEEVSLSTTSNYASCSDKNINLDNSSDTIPVTISYNKSTTTAVGWLDYLLVNIRRKLIMENYQMHFTDITSVGTDNVALFQLTNTNSNTLVWDITEPSDIKQIKASYTNDSLIFKIATDSLRKFIAFNSQQIPKPVLEGQGLGLIENQDLHSYQYHDMIIVTHKDFIDEAEDLAQVHRDYDDMSVLVATTEQVYNEFSGGIPDVSAIRNFVKMIYKRPDNPDTLKYLLLFGDGSYDNKTTSTSNTNYIPTYQSVNSLNKTASFVSDDFFGLLDDDEGASYGYVDIGIGRLPVKSKTEAQDMFNKITRYLEYSSMGEWRNRLCFIADDADEDQTLHMTNADEITEKIAENYPSFNIKKIYLDAYTQITTTDGEKYPDANDAINQAIEDGTLIINYTGHGTEKILSGEGVVTLNEISKWENYDCLPMFVTATCEFSRFDSYDREIDFAETSAGEEILLKADGGGIALYTTTRLAFSGTNQTMNEYFYDYIFNGDDEGNCYRLGDIIRLTKIAYGTKSSTNKRNYTLLGDPALKLAYPHKLVSTDFLNNETLENADTIQSLTEFEIKGYIRNDSNEVIDNYSGVLYLTIFGSPEDFVTLGNDGAAQLTFTTQENEIHKGTATIENGEFSYSYTIPENLVNDNDSIKFSYYAKPEEDSLLNDITGFYHFIVKNGDSEACENENSPEIEFYLDSPDFVYGGFTDANPTLYANITDANGINSEGTGFDRDITAVIDDDTQLTIVLNDYFDFDINSYKSGSLTYQLPDLSTGTHNISLEVWNICDLEAESYLEFIVVETSEPYIEKIYAYPNPATSEINFYIEHNQSGIELDIEISIFSIEGRLQKIISKSVTPENTSSSIMWDRISNDGGYTDNGMYVYQVKIETPDGKCIKKFEKLLLL